MSKSIFYSWQSDSPAKTNRFLIRDCLLEVLKKLNKEQSLDEAVRLDSDTSGIPGTPDIANTIYTKIREAGVFVADLTLSSEAATGKRSPNPNVLIELGYAFSAIGDSRVISVINTEFGEAKELPFDLAHKRWPIQYLLTVSDLEDKEKRDDVRKNLIGSLYTAIRLVLDSMRSPPIDQLKLAGAPSFNYVQQCISLSDPREDWERISSGFKSVAVNKKDVNLRLEVNYSEEGTQCRDFIEEWANRHPDPHATGYWCDIYYNCTHVFRTILVSVDGGRAQLPIPRQKGMGGKYSEVLPFDYRVAQIFDTLGTLDEYMTRSRLSLAFE
jgi:hypothetical protein